MKKRVRSFPKWTIARRIVQFSVFMIFLTPLLIFEIEGDNFFFGSLASSSFFGVALSDPFAALQITLATRKINYAYIGGALLILGFYSLIRGRVFCSWVCPVNIILEFIDKIRKYVNLPDKPLNRHLKVYLAVMVLLLSLVIGVPVFEIISPISGVMRNVLFSFGIGIVILLAIILFDLLVSRRGWCRYVCPLGGFYQAVGRIGLFRVKFNHDVCMGCDQCRRVCFSDPDILLPGINRVSEYVTAGDCSLCGACVDHCPFGALEIISRHNESIGENPLKSYINLRK